MVNTLMPEPVLEGLVDSLGPFNPAGTIGETYNMSPEMLMGTWASENGVDCYSEPIPAGWTGEQIDQRVALIDQLLTADPNSAAAALLQQSRAALLAKPR